MEEINCLLTVETNSEDFMNSSLKQSMITKDIQPVQTPSMGPASMSGFNQSDGGGRVQTLTAQSSISI